MEKQREFEFTYPDQTTKDRGFETTDAGNSFTITIDTDDLDTSTYSLDIPIADSAHPTGFYDWPMGGEFSLSWEPEYKFNEGELIREFEKYVQATYDTHYSEEKFQATEFIIDGGHGTGFCIGNILKYAQRYGKKGTHKDARKDLLKVMHYALFQLYIHDLSSENEDCDDSSDHSSDD